MENVKYISILDVLSSIIHGIKTISDLLNCVEKININDLWMLHMIQFNNLIIDKDNYNLCKSKLVVLEKIKFDFNLINFNIIIENLHDYINLLNIFENNNLILEKIDNKYDINSFQIVNIEPNLNTIKILNDKNFNFELLRLENVVNLNINIIRYLIDNKLYNFLNKNELNIISNCSSNNFEFFINYFNFDVYKLYDDKSLYYYLYKFDMNSCNKLKILYEKYNLLIDKNELSLYNDYMYYVIFQIYSLEDIYKYDIVILQKILKENLIFYNRYTGTYKFNDIPDLTDKYYKLEEYYYKIKKYF